MHAQYLATLRLFSRFPLVHLISPSPDALCSPWMMCLHEIVGDYWTGCGHFHGRYFTGITSDCNSALCKSSVSHVHKTAHNCGCPSTVTEDRRVQNMYRTSHPDCLPPSR